MSDSFHRTVRALHADGMSPAVLGVILSTALIAVWCWWLVHGRVSLYETSSTARVEVDRVYPVAATVGGRIVASHLELGRQVRRGDVLVEIEAEREKLETSEERARLAALTSQLAAIETEITAEQQAIALTRRAAHAALSELKPFDLAQQTGSDYARLLDAEEAVSELWSASGWRRLSLRDGSLLDDRPRVEPQWTVHQSSGGR